MVTGTGRPGEVTSWGLRRVGRSHGNLGVWGARQGSRDGAGPCRDEGALEAAAESSAFEIEEVWGGRDRGSREALGWQLCPFSPLQVSATVAVMSMEALAVSPRLPQGALPWRAARQPHWG